MSRPVANFGGDVRFTPRHFYAPTTEAEVLAVLDRHAAGKVRVVGARHSWNAGIVSDDALLDLRHFDTVTIHGGVATVGGGCRIKHVLRKLHALGDFTLPSIGLITEQTIAGAISTATHGSGRHSLSHYATGLRVAAYDAATGKARVYDWSEGDPELRAARCAVGCMGVVLAVRFRCVPRYDVAETTVACDSIDDVLAAEDRFPLQQFYLLPHRWTYLVQRRAVTPAPRRRRHWTALLYRAWWLIGIDVGLHLNIKLLASVLRSGPLTRAFFRHVVPNTVVKNRTVVDRGERMLVMEHELFRHLEIEVYVPARHVRPAAAFVRRVLEAFDGTADSPPAELGEEILRHRGTFTPHYPVTFRKVLPDAALIAPSAGDEPYYAISFITYVEPREPFLALASFLARAMTRLFQARLHWGKYFPLDEAAYPELPAFRAHCRRVDPHGVFRNAFTERVLFGNDASDPAPARQ